MIIQLLNNLSMAKKTISRLSVDFTTLGTGSTDCFSGSMFQNIGVYQCDTG